MLDYYDWVLALIPLSYVVGVVATLHEAVALHHGLAAGSLIASIVLYDAVIRNPPVETPAAKTAATAMTGLGWLLALLLYLR